MSRADRFKLKSAIVDVLRTPGWSFERTQLLFREFDIEGYDGDSFGPSIADVVSTVKDRDLADLYSLATGAKLEEIETALGSAVEDDHWKPGYVRLFISHSALHKKFAAEVAESLAAVGIDAFVAHDSMTPTKPWQAQIERALRSMQLFVLLAHPEVAGSDWCQQEMGWALGRNVNHFAIRLGADPSGFFGRDQWPSEAGSGAEKVAMTIASWATTLPGFDVAITRGLFEALRDARNYVDAGNAAKRVAALGTLNSDQFNELDEIWWGNNQLHGGSLAHKAMMPLYHANNRPWPPPKPS
jgi:hypothetical protein